MKFFIKLVLFVLFLAACYYGYEYFFNKQEKISYVTIKPTKGDITQSIESVGTVFAASSVDVGAQVSGQIKKLYVKLGDKVKKGDKIADIDDVPQKNEVKKNEAQLEIFKTRLEAKKTSFKVTKKEYEREKALYKRGATSLENLDKAKDAYVQEKANIKELEANIIQTNIDLSTAKTNVGYTRIISPMDGTIIALPAQEGQTVNARQTTPNLTVVADLSLMEVKMEIAEGDITKIKEGQEVVFNILSSDKKFHSKLSFIDPANTTISDNLQSTSSSSAVYYYAKFLVPNEKGLLRIGMTTQNSIVIKEAKNILMLPISAIKSEGKNKYVYILENKTHKKVKVELGISNGINIEIKSGLKEDDNVITSSINKNDPSKRKIKMRVR